VSAGVTLAAKPERRVSAFAGIPAPVLALIAAAWVVAALAEGAGAGLLAPGGASAALRGPSAISFFCPLHFAAPLGGGAWAHVHAPSFWLALVLFLLTWQSMIAAMMLPTSLPLVRLFAVTSRRAPARRRAFAAFLGGYALVWTAFGALAFVGDAFLHRTIASDPWLRGHEWLIVGSVLALAGAVQFSSLKDRCLTECRHPGAFLIKHYRRGVGGGFALGRRHGLFCLGCCWALMLVMFAAGAASLIWMGILTVLMVHEKMGRSGKRAVPLTGIVLFAWAALVLAHPAGLPVLLRGGV
jgi:predicted metal-binding membrane protein